ncbi:hypothetical protein [Terrabacter sp. NPDC000476]|uniref:hypothetical protein n=1 Tax=Terrabacter sp. NPDC000476 TaxID=3154258 RepID=UPI003320F0C8
MNVNTATTATPSGWTLLAAGPNDQSTNARATARTLDASDISAGSVTFASTSTR